MKRIRKAKLFIFLRQHREEALGLVLNVLQVLETWVQTLQQEEAILAQPFLKIAKPGERARCTHR